MATKIHTPRVFHNGRSHVNASAVELAPLTAPSKGRGPAAFDVFLCHNSADAKAVLGLGNQLRLRGIRPWIDTEQLRPGTRFQRELEKMISRIPAVVVLVGKNGRGPWQDLEIEGFLRQSVLRGCTVIPTILADTAKTPKLPGFLEGLQWVDFRREEPDPLTHLIWGITGTRQGRQ